MGVLRILNFKGAVPKVHPRLLPENYAQIARNTRLENGTIGPVRRPTLAHTFDADVGTIYLDGETWRGWAGIVDVAPAPIAANRLYYTGDGEPKMMNAGTVYDLALEPPTEAPTISNDSTPDASLLETVFYVYTYVTGFGEESQPSPLSDALETSPGVTVDVTGFTAPPAGRNITARRIYRSQTSASGTTTLFFVAEILLATTTYEHDPDAVPPGEVIPSTDYDPPPDDLVGLTSMPNGMMAAFVGKVLYFAEPYQPHAWPVKYTLTVDSPIVGLAAFGSSLAILTEEAPHIVQGTSPDTMVMERMDKSLPCLSRRGIVDVGYAAYFPSTEGLAMISGDNAQVVTRGLFTREQWRNLGPDSFIADAFDDRYVFTYVFDTFDVYDMGDEDDTGPDTLVGGQETVASGLPVYDFGTATSAFGEQRLGMLDLTGEQPYLIDTDVIVPAAMHRDEEAGDLFMLEGARDVMLWEDRAAAPATQLWKSRAYVLPFPTNYSAALVQTDENAEAGNTLMCRIIADGVPVTTISQSNRPVRLPSGFKAKTWEVEFESNIAVTGFAMAHSVEELAAL